MHPSFLHLGRFQLPAYGICAAAGAMAALALSAVTARRARLDPDKVWDALVVTAMAGLVASRALLVAGSFRFFLQQPLLLLSLPTVNDTGLLLTAAIAGAYLWWKRLPLWRFLDAATPCAALLWTFLSLGRLLEGTREGMPSRSGRVWPVELLAVLASALVSSALTWPTRGWRRPGRVTAFGMAAAGAAVFALDFLRLPSDLDGTDILDPVQWLGLAMIVAAGALVIADPAAPVAKTGGGDAF